MTTMFTPKDLAKAIEQTVEEALSQCAAGRKVLSREQIWKLNRIQRNMEFLRPLAEQHLLPANQELLAWYSIWERLHIA